MVITRVTCSVVVFCLSASAFLATEAEPTPLAFTEVVQVDGVTHDQLYLRAKVWFAETFVDSKHVLEVEDKDAGLLVGKGTVPFEVGTFLTSHTRGEVGFVLKLAIKDERYRFELSQFRHVASPVGTPLGIPPVSFGLVTTDPNPPPVTGIREKPRALVWRELQRVSNGEATRLIESLKAGMKKGSAGKESW